MKKPFLLGVIFAICVGIAAIVFAQVYPEGMISYWKLDEGSGVITYDSVGTSDGILVNGPIWTTGQVNDALSFDGVDDYVDFDDHAKYYLGFNKSDDAIFSFHFKSTSTDKGIIYGQCRGDAYGYNPGVHIALNANGTTQLHHLRPDARQQEGHRRGSRGGAGCCASAHPHRARCIGRSRQAQAAHDP